MKRVCKPNGKIFLQVYFRTTKKFMRKFVKADNIVTWKKEMEVYVVKDIIMFMKKVN